jgi:hypothetical protein
MRKLILLSTLIIVLALAGPGVRPAAAQDESGWILSQINNLRASRGLPAYALNGALSNAATNHSIYLANNPWVDPHREANGSTPRSRIAAAGYGGSNIGENVYGGGMATAQIAFNWWMNSPVHLQGMLNANFTEIGIGIASGPYGHYYTTTFGGGMGGAPAGPAPQPVTVQNSSPGVGAAAQPAPTAKPIRRLPTAIPTNTPGPDQPPTAAFTPIPSRTPTPQPQPEGPTATPFIFDLTPQSGAYVDIQTTALPTNAVSAVPVRVAAVSTATRETPAASQAAPQATGTPVGTPASARAGLTPTAIISVADASQTGDTANTGNLIRALLPVAIGVQVLLLAGIALRRNRH